MENQSALAYQVFARKYRPKKFDDVLGQNHIVTVLKNAILQDTIAHAYLFSGTRGVGKTTCARIFAQAINCEKSRENKGNPCGSCVSCQSALHQEQFNVIELDAASNNSVENIREWIGEARISPSVGKYKVYILDEAHMLSTQAFNAFLKTLEEPPKHVIFILATTEKHKLLPTILSRCQVLDFVTIGIDKIVDNLKDICQKESIEFDEHALYIIAEKAEGSMRDALSIFDKVLAFSGKKMDLNDVQLSLQIVDDHFYLEQIRFYLQADIQNSLLALDKILRDGHPISTILDGINRCLRNLLMIKDEQTLQLADIYPSLKKSFQDMAEICTFDFLLSALAITHQAMINMRFADNKRYFLEFVILQLSQLQHTYALLDSDPQMPIKPMQHRLALPTRQGKHSIKKTNFVSPNHQKPQQSLYIEMEEKRNLPLENSALIVQDILKETRLSENRRKKSVLEIIREKSEQKIRDKKSAIRLTANDFEKIKVNLAKWILEKNNSAMQVENILSNAEFELFEEKNTLKVTLASEMDKFYFLKEIKQHLLQYMEKQYHAEFFIESLHKESDHSTQENTAYSKEEEILKYLKEHREHIYDFILKHHGKIIA